MLGQQLDHYRILERIGTGGMGEVYRAVDQRLGRQVAIKVLSAERARDPRQRARFGREARAAAVLDHPNICVLHDAGEHQGTAYMVMELLQGRTLRQHLGGRSLPLPDLLSIAIQTAEALAAAHGSGVVHRDLKPENILITPRGRVKVFDFGLASAPRSAVPSSADFSSRAETATGTLTPVGSLLGTPGYTSPEQAAGDRVDCRSDLFSLGVVLCEMATGAQPFGGRTRVERLASLLRDEPLLAGLPDGEVWAELRRIIARCLEKDLGRRYQNADEVVMDLRCLERSLESDRPATPAGRNRERVCAGER